MWTGDPVESLRHVYLIMKKPTKHFFKAIYNLRKVKIWKKFEFSVFDGFLGQRVLQYELSSVSDHQSYALGSHAADPILKLWR